MKINPQDFNSFFNNIPDNINSALIYGVDNGLVFERAKLFEKHFKKKHTEITIIKYDYEDIKNGKVDLKTYSRNLSFFASFQLIIIENISPKIEKDIQALVEKAEKGFFFIFLGNELSPASSFRKYFESTKNTACIACYHDNEKAIRNIAASIFTVHNKKASEDVYIFIEQFLKGDRKNTISELEKLITFVGSKKEVHLEDVKSCCSLYIDFSYDYFSHAFASKDSKSALFHFNNLVSQGSLPIALMRYLLNYFIRLYCVKSLIVNHCMEERPALQKLSPPVFVMHIDGFLRHVRNFSLTELEKILDILLNLEMLSKKTKAPVHELTESAVYSSFFKSALA